MSTRHLNPLFFAMQFKTYTCIKTPFFLPDGTNINVYQRKNYLSDLGETYRWINTVVYPVPTLTSLQKTVCDVCQNLEIRLEGLILYADLDKKNEINLGICNLIQVMVTICSLYYYKPAIKTPMPLMDVLDQAGLL